MSRADWIIHTEADRATMLAQLTKAPIGQGFTVTAKRAKRTVPQNARMWAMLTQVSKEIEWHGSKLAPEDWKLIFMQALGHEMRIAPNIAGNGFVSLGGRSSELTKDEFSDLMELITAFAAERGVIIENPKESEAAETEGAASEKTAADPPSVREPASPAKPRPVSAGDAHKMTEAEADEYAAQWADYYATLPAGEPEDAFCAETQHVASVFLKQEFHRAYRLMQAAVFAEKKDAA